MKIPSLFKWRKLTTNKKKKVVHASTFIATDARVTRSTQEKKPLEPKVYAKKQTTTRKKGSHHILQEESKEIKSKEDTKKLKATSKKSKLIGETPKQDIPIIASFKPLGHYERTMKTLKKKKLDDVREFYDSFDDNQKQVVKEVINYLYQNDRSPHSIQKNILDFLFSILDNKWKKVINQGNEMIDGIFLQYFPNLCQEEMSDLLDKYKGQFHVRAMRLKLLIGKVQEVEDDIHIIAKKIVSMEKQWEQYENMPRQTKIGAPLELEGEKVEVADEVYIDKGERVTSSPPTIFTIDDEEETIDEDTNNATGTTFELVHTQEQ